MASQSGEHFLYKLMAKALDMDSDSFKIILMDSSFVYDSDTHKTYADCSSDELGTGYGYTANTKTLTTPTLTEDNTNHRATWTADAVSWVASGGSIGPTVGAIIFDDTSSDDTVVMYIDFGSAVTKTTGQTLLIENIELRLPR